MAGDTVRLTKSGLRGLKYVVIVIGLFAALDYGGEDLALRLRIPKSHEPLSSLEVTRYYAIHKKNGKIEYASDAPETVVCVNSMFPHFGYSPCWYVRKQGEKRIDM